MKLRILILVIATLNWCNPAIAADTVYVIDKLLVGVHQDQDLNSAIIKVLPTGTKLDVVRRDGELALIKDPDGTSGWVDAAYLMVESPAQVKVDILSAENAALTAKLAAASSSNATTASPASSDGRDKLTKENTELKGKLSAEKLKSGELQSKISALEAKVADRPTTPADTIIAELEAANKSFAHDLEAAVQANQALESRLDEHAGLAVPSVIVESFSTPVLVAVAITLMLAFGAGVYLMDYLHRRRHGGFRI